MTVVKLSYLKFMPRKKQKKKNRITLTDKLAHNINPGDHNISYQCTRKG